MRKIYTIGETLYDIIFKNGIPQGARPGGAMLNSAVSLGRVNAPVSFISECGSDEIGILIDKFLKRNKVNTSFLKHYPGINTNIAMAFLDKKNNASYSFYKIYPEKRSLQFPVIHENDIVVFGSFFAMSKEIRSQLAEFLNQAKKKNALIIYDPNFRRAYLKELKQLMPLIIENIKLADIVRASDEDMKFIFDADSADSAYAKISRFCRILIYTKSDEFVSLKSNAGSLSLPVNRIKPVSTIGAGDSFNAGIIHALYKNKIKQIDINEIKAALWHNILNTGIAFARNVCMSLDNYISWEFADKLS